MPISKFQKFGLRRDRNLSDLEDKNLSLQNILDGLSTDELGFLPEDIAVINEISKTDITSDDFAELQGTVRTYTPAGEATGQEDIQPLVTVKDNISNYKIVSENPPVAVGGFGPNAYYYPSSAIGANVAVQGSNNSLTIDDIFVDDTDRKGPYDFWETGTFVFGDKIDSEFSDSFGGILWEGYLSSISNIKIGGNGFFHIEQDIMEDDNWTTGKTFYNATRIATVQSISFENGVTVIGLSEDDMKKVLIGDQISSTNPGSPSDIFVSDVYSNSNFITVSSDITGSYSVNDSIIFFYDFAGGIDYQTEYFSVFRPQQFDRIKTRIAVWWPDPSDFSDINLNFYLSKSMEFDGSWDSSASTTLPYSNFYTQASNTTPIFNSYRFFYENSIGRLNSNANSFVESTQTIRISYEPELQFSGVSITPSTISLVPMGRGKLTNLVNATIPGEVGDWVIFDYNSETYALQIIEREDSRTIYVDRKYFDIKDELIYVSANIFKNIGLIGVYKTTNGTDFDVVERGPSFSPSDVKNDDIVVSYNENNTRNTNFLRLTNVTSNDSSFNATIDAWQGVESIITTGVHSRGVALVYSSSGLRDFSSSSECVGVYGVEVTAAASSGSNIITVSNTSGLSTSDWVQFGTPGTVVPIGTTVSSIDSGTQITISNNLVSNIPQNSTLTLIDSGQPNPGAVDKSFCVLPLNTAPPFESTNLGLRTSATNSKLDVNQISFDELNFTFTTNSDITPTSNTDTGYTRTLPLSTANGNFSFLIK